MTPLAAGAQAILAFWFDEIGPERWWVRSADTDAACIARFADLWQEWRGRPADDFLGTPDEALGGVVLFDQFPRNMFRHRPEAFATDPLARAIAAGALDRGYDADMDAGARSFLYMPFMHSEDLADQDRLLRLFEQLGVENNLNYARIHHEMIARYSRFPARNVALGRADRPNEAQAIAESAAW